MKLLWSVMLLVILGLQYRLWIGDGSYAAVWLLEDKVELQISKNKILENRNNRLNEEVLDLKSGYEVIEERARFDLGMIRRNESFYMVVTSSNLR
ncbi:MAG: cell division protein FtsB [Oleiphilaceae bacterium]|jgi:cell division protein FtsB